MASETAVLKIDRFQTFPIIFLRAVGIIAFLASYVGTCITFIGGWGMVWSVGKQELILILIGVIYQTAFSLGQVGCKSRAKKIDRRWWLAYIACLVFSFVPSFQSFGPYLYEVFLSAMGAYIAYILSGAILLAADILPEWILFDDD